MILFTFFLCITALRMYLSIFCKLAKREEVELQIPPHWREISLLIQ